MGKKSVELVEPGHPLVLIVLAMRAFDSADEAIEKMLGLSDFAVASEKAIQKAIDIIQAVRDQEVTVSKAPELAHVNWNQLTGLGTETPFLVYGRGVTQGYEILEEFLDRAGRWNWGHTIKTIPIRRHMKKFRVDVEIPFPTADYEVWGDDEAEVHNAFAEHDLDELFPDLEVDVRVREIPATPISAIRDGVATESRGWIVLASFKDEDGDDERIWPTDDESKDNIESDRQRRQLEDQAQRRLPLGSADSPTE